MNTKKTKKRNKTFVNNWSKIRENGKWKYIFLHGILLFGIIAGLFSFLIEVLIWDTWDFKDFISLQYVIHQSAFLIGGFFYGITTWYYYEKVYLKRTKQNTD